MAGDLSRVGHLGDGVRRGVLSAAGVDDRAASRIPGQNEGVVGPHRHIHAGGDHGRTGGIHHGRGHLDRTASGGAHAQAAKVVVAEGVDPAALGDDEGDLVSGHDLHGGIILPPSVGPVGAVGDLADLVQGGAAQLSAVVTAPTPDGAVALQGQDVVLAHGDHGPGHVSAVQDGHFHVARLSAVHQDLQHSLAGGHAGQDPASAAVVHGKDSGIGALHGPDSRAAEVPEQQVHCRAEGHVQNSGQVDLMAFLDAELVRLHVGVLTAHHHQSAGVDRVDVAQLAIAVGAGAPHGAVTAGGHQMIEAT